MKRATIIAILIAILAFIASVAMAQCQFWPIAPLSGVPVSVTTPYDPAFQPLCDTCGTQGCANWEISGQFNGEIVIYSPDTTIAHIWITEQCSLVLADTCTNFGPDPLDSFRRTLSGSNLQIRCCGVLPGTVSVTVTCQLSPIYSQLQPYFNLNGCMVGMPEPQPKPRQYAVFDGFTWIIQDKPPALGWCKEL